MPVKSTIGKKPVVVVPLEEWNKIESVLEDLEMMSSAAYQKKIATTRKEKRLYSSAEIKKLL